MATRAKGLAAACLLLFVAAPAQPAEQKGARLSPASLSLRIDADGNQSELACGPTVAAALCPVLTKAVSRWKFAPGKRNGAPAAIDVWLTLYLVAVEKPGGFAVQATSAYLSLRDANANISGVEPSSRALNPPSYPREEQRRGIGAFVVVEISRQPGSPHPLIGAAWRDGHPADASDPFVRASRAAIINWELEPWPAERVSTCVTMEFTVDKPRFDAGQLPDKRPCVDRYADGLALPKLLTDPATASF